MSEKAKTNKKWTSNQKYKDNYDRIFGDKKHDCACDKKCESCKCEKDENN